MLNVPPTRYARRADGVSIAWQSFGDAALDLIVVPGFISHLDLQWADPGYARFMERLAQFARVILFDKPGTGISDPIPHVPTLEERMHDIATVLDAAGSERAVLFGSSEGGPACALFAAMQAERVSHLVLYGSFAKGRLTMEDFAELDPGSIGVDDPARVIADVERSTARARELADHWGEGRSAEIFAPGAGGFQRRFFAMFERAAASPARVHALVGAIVETDVTGVLSSIRSPTLVVHRTGDFIDIAGGRYLAAQIPGAELAELPGSDHAFWVGDSEAIAARIEEFVTGSRRTSSASRVLATVLFTDIVGSTERAAAAGDEGWRATLERHHAVVRRELERHDGREIDTAGDGFLVAFDGPAQAIRCAEAVIAALADELGLAVRAGVHTGEAELASDGRLAGLAVHIGARVAAAAGGGEVMVSSTVKELVAGSGIEFEDRGTRELKGVPGEWRLYAVRGWASAPPPLPPASEAMTRADRTAVALARRAPTAMRLAARVVGR